MRVRRTMCAATVAAGLAFGVGTDKRWSAGAERNRRSGRRGRRPVAGAHQDQHEQPAGQRSAGGRAVARPPRPRSGSRSRCSRHLRRARPTSPLGSVPRTRRRSRCCWRAMRTWSVSSASCGTSTPSAAWCAGATSSAAAPWTSRAAWRPGGLHGRGHAARPLQGYAQPRRDPPRRSRRGGRRLRHVLACGEPLAQDRGRNIAQRWLGARGSRRDAPSDGDYHGGQEFPLGDAAHSRHVDSLISAVA